MQSPYKSLIYKGFLLSESLIFTPCIHPIGNSLQLVSCLVVD